jgi:hypothetical protein
MTALHASDEAIFHANRPIVITIGVATDTQNPVHIDTTSPKRVPDLIEIGQPIYHMSEYH